MSSTIRQNVGGFGLDRSEFLWPPLGSSSKKPERARQTKKKPKLKIKPYVIKNNLYVFVNCLIENPTFDTQTKEYLTLKQSAFGSTFDFNKIFFQKLLATDIIDQIIQIAENKENQ